MGISKYTRFGLRADKNLSDLPNKNTALGNILDDFVPGKSFAPSDLTVINGLKSTNLFAVDLAPIANTEVLYTPIVAGSNGISTLGVPSPVIPQVTVKDQIQSKKVRLGDPPYRRGGSGPNSFVVPSSALNANAGQLSHGSTITADNIFDTTNAAGNIITTEDYWIDGRFAFSGQLHPTFSDSFGALSWDGWLSNSENRSVRILTNAFFLLEEYVPATTSWVTKKHVSEETFNVTSASAVTDSYTFTVNLSDVLHLCTGMIVTQGSSTFEITEINHSSGAITVQRLTGTASGVTFGSGDSIAISWNIGTDDITFPHYFTGPMLPGETKRIRLTAWYPKPDSFATPKNVTNYSPFKLLFDLADGTTIGDDTPFIWWYKSQQNAPGSTAPTYSFEHFRRNKIDYRNRKTNFYLQNQQPVYMTYEPKTDVDEISKINSSNLPSILPMTWKGDYQFTATTTNLEVGDILLFSGLNTNGHYYLQIYDIQDSYVTVDPHKGNDMNAIMSHYSKSVGDTVSFFVVKPKGLIGLFTETVTSSATSAGAVDSHSGNVFLNTNKDFVDTDIKQNDLIVHFNATTGPERFRRISTEIGGTPGTNVTFDSMPINTNDTSETFAGGLILVYAHRGLSDHSTAAQCAGVFGKEVMNTANAGATQVFLSDVNGITADPSTGDFVQLAGIVPGTNTTRVTAINSPSGNPPYFSITLSAPLAATLPASRTIVFVKNANDPGSDPVTGNKELCVIPLNTAPPFAGTDLGLSTVASHPHLSIGGDFEITGINIKQATSSVVASPGTATADTGLLLKEKTGSSTYKDYWILMD